MEIRSVSIDDVPGAYQHADTPLERHLSIETERYNRRNTRAKSNWQKLLGINHTDTIDEKEKFNKAALA